MAISERTYLRELAAWQNVADELDREQGREPYLDPKTVKLALRWINMGRALACIAWHTARTLAEQANDDMPYDPRESFTRRQSEAVTQAYHEFAGSLDHAAHRRFDRIAFRKQRTAITFYHRVRE